VRHLDVTLTTALARTPRVMQVEGMFDLSEAKYQSFHLAMDVPIDERDWKIGLIVGPSGAGKSATARALFGDALIGGYPWDDALSIIDQIGAGGVQEAVGALTAVGFGSTPAWLRPYRHLSNGEQFRATLARALLEPREVVVFDEFTSVVDRVVARIGSAAVAAAVRRREKTRFVAVTCHEDVLDWLQPDWVLEPHLGRFAWRSLQRRPDISLAIRSCSRDVWAWFRVHHYLSDSLAVASLCYVATVDDVPVGFIALLPFPHNHRHGLWRVHRVVVLPEWQGVGVGRALLNVLGGVCKREGLRLSITTSHPGLARSLPHAGWRSSSPMSFAAPSSSRNKTVRFVRTITTHRRTATYVYAGPSFVEGDIKVSPKSQPYRRRVPVVIR
jgi:ABC-type thiamine transport system ATPase subunit